MPSGAPDILEKEWVVSRGSFVQSTYAPTGKQGRAAQLDQVREKYENNLQTDAEHGISYSSACDRLRTVYSGVQWRRYGVGGRGFARRLRGQEHRGLGRSGRRECGWSLGRGHSGRHRPGGSVTVADDGKPFVPDDIKYSIIEGGRALTLLSATVISDATGVYWLIAVRNDETVPICIPQVNAAFTDAMTSSNSAGGQVVIMIQGPMYQSDAGAHPCLLPGATGMGVQAVSGLDSTAPKITAIEYQPRGYPSPEATKLPDLAVEGVKITDGPMGGKLVTGGVANHSTGTASGPELTIFAVDSGGRPFDAGYTSSMTDLAAASSWPFQVTIPTPFNKYVAFPVWGQQ